MTLCVTIAALSLSHPAASRHRGGPCHRADSFCSANAAATSKSQPARYADRLSAHEFDAAAREKSVPTPFRFESRDFRPAAARGVTQKPHSVTQKPAPAINKSLCRNNL
jgi:hypothetical protein